MKRFALFLTFFFALFMISIPLQAQGTEPIPFDINSLFVNFTGFCAGVIILTGVITKLISLSALGRSILSWVIALIVGLIGWWLKLGMFSGIDFVQVLVIVISFAIGSNVVYNVPWLRELLAKLKVVTPKAIKK